jgi:uncharacterized integral membrane protein
MKPKLIVILVLALLLLIFLMQNTQVVTLKLYFWELSMSQIILIPLALIVGFVAGFVVAKLTGKRGGKEVSPGGFQDTAT